MPAPAPLQQNTVSNSDPNDNCLMCHSDPDFKGSLQNGELLSLYVDSGEYGQSVHGPAGLNCVACHTNVSRYPHHTEEQITCIECHGEDGGAADTSYVTLRVQLPYSDHRELTLDRNESCRSCHEQEYEVAGPSAHVRVFEGGNRDSATCIDCHGSHGIADPKEPRARIAQICGDCHEAVYSTYRSSVHGMALMTASNPDVPTCVDCHGVHNVRGPRDPTYRNDSIAICGDCHGDHQLMTEYDIPAQVVQTYQNDFHGRTVDFFRRHESSNPSNKAVCFDCHGIHNIRQCDDPLSTVHAGNLQQTCQQCHAGASSKFVSSFNHELPTWEKTPVESGVNLAYSILTPTTIGGFLVYIGLDVGRRWYDKRRRVRQARILAERELEEDFTNDI
jgi:predicted CXXCH cytochrome family protein